MTNLFTTLGTGLHRIPILMKLEIQQRRKRKNKESTRIELFQQAGSLQSLFHKVSEIGIILLVMQRKFNLREAR